MVSKEAKMFLSYKSDIGNEIAEAHRLIIRNLEFIKVENMKLMNHIHKTNLGKNFWWALSGEYALLSKLIYYRFNKEKHVINHIINQGRCTHNVVVDIDERLKNFFHNDLFKKLDQNSNLYCIYKPILIDAPYYKFEKDSINLTNFEINLSYIYLFYRAYNKLKYYLTKLTKKEKKKSYLTLDNECDYSKIFLVCLPPFLRENFPKFFIKFLPLFKIKSINTYFGLELNIFQLLVIAHNFQNQNNELDLNIIPHGSGVEFHIADLFRHSLTKKPVNYLNNSLKLSNLIQHNCTYDVLFCPPQEPFLPEIFYSIDLYNQYLVDYQIILKNLEIAKINGLKIKFRYKNENYLKHKNKYILENESIFNKENRKFEDCYYDYTLIMLPQFGTIAGKCIYNNLNFLCLNKPYFLASKSLFLSANDEIGVCNSTQEFIKKFWSFFPDFHK